jgi:hypothetical protein
MNDPLLRLGGPAYRPQGPTTRQPGLLVWDLLA